MNCPKCQQPMTCGVPHVDYPAVQYECHRCNVYIVVLTHSR